MIDDEPAARVMAEHDESVAGGREGGGRSRSTAPAGGRGTAGAASGGSARGDRRSDRRGAGPGGAGSAGSDNPRSVAVMGDRILVALPVDAERRTKTGILIPATAQSIDRKGVWGEVIAIGPNVRHISAGDEVLYLPDEAIEVDIKGDAYLIVRERDIHATASDRRDGTTGLYL